MPDHVHMLISIPPKHAVSAVVCAREGALSARCKSVSEEAKTW